ncbi:MAG TPA: outer membrane beta-barrel family protein [Salinimicrobium sp.]|nr:outer membrane beta-barrel family protein [Salinimicrobium sp.]
MKKTLLFSVLSFLFFFSENIYSQHKVHGKIVDENAAPVPYATVLLLTQSDSVFYKGSISGNAGEFNFTDIASNKYILKVSFVGYEDFSAEINVQQDLNLNDITIKEAVGALNEINISVKNPSVTRGVDRLIFNVHNTSLSTGNTWNIIKKTPGVLVMEDEIIIRNSSVVVYLNDRKVQLSASELRELLENYDASNIKSVEVMMNPPAKYEAEGGAVLNIITSKNISLGYKGNVNGSYTQAVFPKYSIGTSHFYKNEKINFFGNYSYNSRKEFKDDDNFVNFINDEGAIFSKWITDFDRTTKSEAHQANIVLDYKLGENDELGFSSNLLFSPDKNFHNQVVTEIYNEADEIQSFFNTESFLINDQRNLGFNLNYKHRLGKEGAHISANAHYTNFDENQMQDVLTEFFDPSGNANGENSFFTNSNQQVNIYTAQIDFVSPIESVSFEMGAKTSFIKSESGMDYFENENNVSTLVPELSDNFLYDENVFATYISGEKSWEKWSAKIGLRAEYTNREGFSVALNQLDKRSFTDLFPTAYLQYNPSENHSFTLDYGRRIMRPRYESLNPFRYYLNEFNYNSGNPNLESAKSHNFNLNYTLQGSYFFDLYYRDNGHYPSNLVFQDNEDFTIRTVYANVLESTSYGLDIAHGRSVTDFWYLYVYVSAFSEEEVFLAVESGNEAVSNSTKGIFVQIYNSFSILKNGTFSGDLSFVRWPKFILGSYQIDPKTTLSVGLRKTLWDKRAELTLNFEDILNMTNSELVSKYKNQYNGYFAKPETQYVRIGFKYNFGNFRLQDNDRSIEAAERDRL